MRRAKATLTVPGRAVEAERIWYDRTRWASWIDGFGHVSSLTDEWPHRGARLEWVSPPGGRGLVREVVTAYEPRLGQTLDVEDERLRGTQRVAFEPGSDSTKVTLTLEYELKERRAVTPVVDALFIRRAMNDSLRRTLRRFATELAAARQFG